MNRQSCNMCTLVGGGRKIMSTPYEYVKSERQRPEKSRVASTIW